MRYKKIMMLAILLVSLFTISAVSAADNVTSDVVGVEETTVNVVKETTDELINVEENNQILESCDGESTNLSANLEGTFTDLANEIANANGELKLTKNYVYDSSKDSNYKNGITINKEITINGRGFVVDGNNNARAFNISCGNVIIRNIEFTNCHSSNYGGAVYWNGENGNLFDCNFIDCISSNYGGAVYWNGVNGSLFYCNFIDCYSSGNSRSTYHGGAVYWNGVNGSLFNCEFRNCKLLGSCDFSGYKSGNSQSGSSYTNCHCTAYGFTYSRGGAVYWNGNNGALYNCDFIDCYSYSYCYTEATSTYYYSYSGYSTTDTISSEVKSYSYCYGGVYWAGNDGSLSNSNFINSSYTYRSDFNKGVRSSSWAKAISNANSTSLGGAVYWNGNNGNLFDCNFIKSNSSSSHGSANTYLGGSSSYGGVIYWNGNVGGLFNCNFLNPTSDYNVGYKRTVYWCGDEGSLFNCSFDGNCYNYENYCTKSSISTVYPVMLIHTSTINNDDRIVIFECTQLVNNISVTLYNVTDRKILFDEFEISSENLISSLNLNNLEEGEYQIVLMYAGDNFYSKTSTNDFFKIGKNPSYEVTISDGVVEGGSAIINVTLNEDATGKIRITLSNYTFTNDLVNGKTSFNIPYVVGGINTYKIKYGGDENYNPFYITDTFKVLFKSNISLNLKENNVFGGNISFTYAITPNCTGIISIFVDNEFKTNISVDEQFELDDIPAGKHNITVIYNGDDYYVTSKNSTILTVSKADPSIKVNSSNIPGTVSFEVILNEKATGNVNVTINSDSYYGNLTDGKVNIIIPNLNAGTYPARVYYNGDNNYNARIYDATVTINKIPTTVVGTADDITYSQNAIINVRGSVEGVVVVKIGENYINNISVMANTLTPISFENIPNGKHDIAITLKPTNTNYAESTYNTEFTVSKKQTSVMANVEDITYSENSIINVKASIDGIAVVKIDETYINNVNVIANTIVPVSFKNIPAGKHDVRITLKPTNTNYDESTYNTEFSVSLKETLIRLDVVDSVYGKDVIVNVTASEDGKIIIKIGDITKEKTVFANTVTKINFGVLAVNSYDVIVSFDAGDNYKLSSGEGKIIVSPAEAKITDIRANNNIYGENTTITVKTNVGGILTVKINNIVKTFNIDANKLTSFDLGKYDVNNYNIDLTLDAGANYTQATGNTKVTITPKQTTVSLDANDEVYGNNVIVKVNASENGKVTVRIGNIVKSVNVDANKVTSVDFGILEVNSYEVSATFDGGKNFNTSSDKDSFEISPKASSVTFVNLVNNYIYSNNVVVNVKSDVAGTVTVKVGDKTQTKQITAGNVVSFDFGILDVNKYDVLVSLNTGSNYISSQNTASITISPKSTVVTLNTKDYDADEKVIVNVTASENGKATIKLGNVIKNVDVMANKIASVDFGVLSTGSYDVVATFVAGNNYIDSSDSANIKVLAKIDEKDINITVPEIKPNQENNIVINLPADATGTVTLIIGDNAYTFNVKNGIANINVPKLDEGNYEYVINYSGDSKYSSFENTGSIDVAKPDPEIVIPPLDEPSEDGSVAIKLPSDATGTVTLVIDGKVYSFPVVNGVANVYMPELNDGNYNYSITYSGDGKYSPFTTGGNLNIIAPKITAKNTAVQYSAKGKYSVTVYGTDGKVANGAEVIFKISGKQVAKAKTNTKGVASYVVTKNPGKYKIQATALGKSVTKTLTVKHIVTLKTVTLKKSAKKLTLQATLAKVNGKYLKKKTITFKINGKKVATAKTNSKGVAKITIKNPSVVKKLKVGKKVTYQATYLKDTVKKTAKIKK